MTASPGREVDANLLRGAALGSAQARADAQDAGGQDLGDLVEALGRGHEVGVEGAWTMLRLPRLFTGAKPRPALRNIITSNQKPCS